MQVRISTRRPGVARDRRARRPRLHRQPSRRRRAKHRRDARRRDRRASSRRARSPARPNELALVHAQRTRRISASSLVGLGDRAKLQAARAGRATPAPPCGTSANATSSDSRSCSRPKRGIAAAPPRRCVAEGAIAGTFDTHDLPDRARPPVVDRPTSRSSPATLRPRGARRAASTRGTVLGEAVNLARQMALTPGQRHDADASRRPGATRSRGGRARVRRARRSSAWRRKGWARCSASRAAPTSRRRSSC